MSVLTEETKEAMKIGIKAATKELFESKIAQRIDEKYAGKKKVKEDESKEDEALDEEEDEELEEEKDDGDSDEDDEPLEEAMKVVAARWKPAAGQKKTGDFTIKRLSDLNKLKKEWDTFIVTDRHGRETQYDVENGKLIEM